MTLVVDYLKLMGDVPMAKSRYKHHINGLRDAFIKHNRMIIMDEYLHLLQVRLDHELDKIVKVSRNGDESFRSWEMDDWTIKIYKENYEKGVEVITKYLHDNYPSSLEYVKFESITYIPFKYPNDYCYEWDSG